MVNVRGSLLGVGLAFCASGCATQQLVHYSMGTLRADRVERVEAAWASTNEVRVAVSGSMANSRTPGFFTLVYHLPKAIPGKPPPIWDLQVQSRKGIFPGIIEPSRDHFQPLEVTRVDQRVIEFQPAVHFYVLRQPHGGVDYVFTPGACLGVKVYAEVFGTPRQDWGNRLWCGFDPVYRSRWWAIPAVPVAFAFDAAVICVFNVPDLMAGLGGGSMHPSGSDRYAKWAEKQVGVNWRDVLTPPRLY